MIENKLIYYSTRAAFDKDVLAGLIAPTSIAFVSEGRTIYTHGVEFNASTVLRDLDTTKSRIDSLIQEYTDRLNALSEELRDQALDLHDDALAEAQRKIDAALESFNALRSDFDDLSTSVGNAERQISTLEGRISSFAEYYTKISEAEDTIARIQSTIDALNGTIVTKGEFAEYKDGIGTQLTEYNNTINLLLGELRETISNLNIESRILTEIGRQINLEEGILHDFATKTWVDTNTTNRVDEFFNSLTPSWTQITSKINDNESSIAGLTTRINTLEDGAESMATLYASKLSVEDLSDAVAAVSAVANSKLSAVDITAQFLNDKLDAANAAKIFAYANEQGSGITLKADQINLDGKTWAEFIALNSPSNPASYGYLTSDGVRFINTTDEVLFNLADGLKHTKVSDQSTHGYWLKNDGTGSVANGNISWDADGTIHIKNAVIDPTNSGFDGSKEAAPTCVVFIRKIDDITSDWAEEQSLSVNLGLSVSGIRYYFCYPGDNPNEDESVIINSAVEGGLDYLPYPFSVSSVPMTRFHKYFWPVRLTAYTKTDSTYTAVSAYTNSTFVRNTVHRVDYEVFKNGLFYEADTVDIPSCDIPGETKASNVIDQYANVPEMHYDKGLASQPAGHAGYFGVTVTAENWNRFDSQFLLRCFKSANPNMFKSSDVVRVYYGGTPSQNQAQGKMYLLAVWEDVPVLVDHSEWTENHDTDTWNTVYGVSQTQS